MNTKEQNNSTEMDTIQKKSLFTKLSPEAAAAVEGGYSSFDENVNFDDKALTRSFKVRSGSDITFWSYVSSPSSNRYFNARVINVKTGHSTRTQRVSVPTYNTGNWDPTVWTNMKGGTYTIEFTDDKDRKYVKGQIQVVYNWKWNY